MKLRCINIDWLELYCEEDPTLFPLDAMFFIRQGYYVEMREYGTRQYRQMFTVFRNSEPWFEVRRCPVSGQDALRVKGIFSPYSCHIRLHNVACYTEFPVVDLENLLFKFRYNVHRIYRLDICLDFETFDRGDKPNDFLQRYMRGVYAKINQSNIAAHGRDTWDCRQWQSVSWGNAKSMVSTKFYNKSLELSRPGHDKPYIKYAWFRAGLIDNWITGEKATKTGTYKPDIWRVEFSIKSSARGWYKAETIAGRKKRDIELPHSLNLYESRLQLITAFASLSQHYFHFKHVEQGKRKYRCRDKVLFLFAKEDQAYVIDRDITNRQTKSQHVRLLELLKQYKENSAHGEVYKACDTIINYLQSSCIAQTLVAIDPQTVTFLQQLIRQRMSGANNTFELDVQIAREITSARRELFL